MPPPPQRSAHHAARASPRRAIVAVIGSQARCGSALSMLACGTRSSSGRMPSAHPASTRAQIGRATEDRKFRETVFVWTRIMAGETVAGQVSRFAGPPAGRLPTGGTRAQGRIAVDEQRFDRLARTVGGQRTRREAMRWLAGSMAAVVALVRGGSAAAHASVQLGGACYDSSQCRDDGGFGPVYCDENGYDYDGPLNCCRYEGGYCGENHENCCGQLECWNGGYCTDVSAPPRVPATGCRWARAARTPANATEGDTGSSASAASPCRG